MVVYVADTLARLSEDVVRRRLARLPEWSGDQHQLTRTIEPSTEAVRSHLSRVLDLSPYGGDLHWEDGRLVITLRTEGAGGVTAYDIALAQRIDDVLIDAPPEEAPPEHSPPQDAPPEDVAEGKDIHGDNRWYETVEVGHGSTQSSGRP